jgi:hypothetical protein
MCILPVVTQAEFACWQDIGVVDLDGSAGREYGFLNGDINPIHM